MSKNKTDASEALRASLEEKRRAIFLKYGEKGAKRLLIGVPVAAVALLLLLVVTFLIPIRSIEVTGDVTMFNEGEIIGAAEIAEGKSLYLRSSGKIERSIRKNLPLASSVKVTKTPLGRVKIDVMFSRVDFYCRIGKYYYALDEDLYVLDRDESRAKYSAFGAVCVKLPETREPIVGEKIVFYDTVEETDTEGETLYKVRKENYYGYISEFLSVLSESGFLEDAVGIRLEQRFDVRLWYADKYQVVFGDVEDLDYKFRVLFGILEEGSTQYADKVTVDVSAPSRASARSDESIDPKSFVD